MCLMIMINALKVEQNIGMTKGDAPTMSDQITHHEALIYVMVTMSAVDREINNEELARIGTLVNNMPIFRDFDVEKLVKTSTSVGEMLGQEGGLDTVLSTVAACLPKKLYETAYALAVEIAAADLDIKQEELRFLQMLRDTLNLDRLTTAAIEVGARARHRLL